MVSMRNTKRQGELTVFSFRQGKKFVAVCLELDIVKEGTDALALQHDIMESVVGYVHAVCKAGLGDDALNRPAPKLYWDKYRTLHTAMKPSTVRSPRTRASIGSIQVLSMKELCAA